MPSLSSGIIHAGEDDRLDHPLLLDDMMGRTFAFRVKWQKEWRQGPILEIKDNKLLAGKIQQQRCRRVLAVEEDVSCALCGEEKETELHLFLYCEIAVQKGTQKLGMV
ncbi:hypothetical protein P8452_03256 [Trifolium repens]|nr:hypothetical protein P8452_03256 [Trifolium repens]